MYERNSTKGVQAEHAPKLRRILSDDHVLCALSGGVDSTVAAVLVHRAVGERLHCIFVDNGLLRKGECELVENVLHGLGLPLQVVDASNAFLDQLRDVAFRDAASTGHARNLKDRSRRGDVRVETRRRRCDQVDRHRRAGIVGPCRRHVRGDRVDQLLVRGTQLAAP